MVYWTLMQLMDAGNLQSTLRGSRDQIVEQQTALRQMEAILSVHKFVRGGQYGDALRELSKLSFLPLDSRTPDRSADAFQNLSPSVQACVPDLLRVSLTCLDNVSDTDGTIRALKTKFDLVTILLWSKSDNVNLPFAFFFSNRSYTKLDVLCCQLFS